MLRAAAAMLAVGLVVGWTAYDRASSASTVPVEGVSLEPDGRTLIVTVLGSMHTDPSCPCWEGYRPEVDLTGDEVILTIHRQHHRAWGDVDCNAGGLGRTVQVTLDGVLANRQLIDGDTGEAVKSQRGEHRRRSGA